MEKCPICQDTASDLHFGSKIPVCRACAAFFRRRVRSKIDVHCINLTDCEHQDITECKYCRMEKCLEFGMKIENVQRYRDRHDNTKPNRKRKSSKLSKTLLSSCYQSLHSCLEINNTPNNVGNLKLLEKNFSQLLISRKHCFPRKPKRDLRLLDALSIYRKDVIFVATWIETTFPEFNILERDQRRILFRNFYNKFMIFETTFLALMLGPPKTWYLPTGDTVAEVSGYYSGSPYKPPKISANEVSKLFSHFWTTFHQSVREPVLRTNITIGEYLSICSLFLWDFGLVGQSEECSNLAHKMRQISYRDLIELCQNSDERVAQIMLLLPAIQKGADLFEEELRLGGLYGILNSLGTDNWYEMVNGPI